MIVYRTTNRNGLDITTAVKYSFLSVRDENEKDDKDTVYGYGVIIK